MSNNKQSSVEWLANEISIYLNFDQRLYLKELIEQAKAMHESEIQKAFDEGNPNGFLLKTGEQYYNETFGCNNEQQ